MEFWLLSSSGVRQVGRLWNGYLVFPNLAAADLFVGFLKAPELSFSFAVHALNVLIDGVWGGLALESLLASSSRALLGHQFWPKSAAFSPFTVVSFLSLLDFRHAAIIPKLVTVLDAHGKKSFSWGAGCGWLSFLNLRMKGKLGLFVLQFLMLFHDSLAKGFLSWRMVFIEKLPSRVFAVLLISAIDRLADWICVGLKPVFFLNGRLSRLDGWESFKDIFILLWLVGNDRRVEGAIWITKFWVLWSVLFESFNLLVNSFLKRDFGCLWNDVIVVWIDLWSKGAFFKNLFWGLFLF